MDAALSSLKAQGMGDDLEIIIQDGDVEPDAGQSDALNKGFAKAKGEWLFWLNADDVLLPGALLKVKEVIDSAVHLHLPPTPKSPQWIAGNVAYLDESGKVIRCAWDLGWKISCQKMPVQVYGPSSFFKRELLEKCGMFDTSLNLTMDIDMWCRFRKAGYWYAKIPALTWGFRIHASSKTHEAQLGGWPKEIADEHKILERRYDLNPTWFNRRFVQSSRLMNGSYLKSWQLTQKWRGCDWKDL